jgi:hypothetical protein
MPSRKSYRFNITWVHIAGEDPDHHYLEAGVVAVSVPRAVARVLGDLNENGYDRRDVRVIDAQNMDIT